MRAFLIVFLVPSLVFCALVFSLAFLMDETVPIREAQVLTYVHGPAITELYPEAENKPIVERKAFELDGRKVMVFPYIRDGKLQGVAI